MGETKEHFIKEDADKNSTLEHSETTSDPICTKKLSSAIDLQELLEKHYYEKLNKYNTLSPEEQENQIPFDDDYQRTSSLKYHLQIRGII